MNALLTDLYQLTMLQGYLEHGKDDDIATFELYFRTSPFQGGFAIAAGLETALRDVLAMRFTAEDVSYLAGLKGVAGAALFRDPFLRYLEQFRFRGHIRGIPEGTVVFPNLPLLQVDARIMEAQVLETMLLCHIGYQTLVATRATRIKEAARQAPVVDFGLRRAQGPNGAMAGTRAAFVGGVDGTSNVAAGAAFGIPVRGTMAHSWVMSFPSELEAFRAYVSSFPDDSVLLVDTYDTLKSGVANAIVVARELQAAGHALMSIRLDSGDLTYLSIKAREMLDEAGFPDVRILASNDLDEVLVADLLQQGARIDAWGVGTRLMAASGVGGSALGCVYKLVALNGEPKIKRSSQVAKMTNPGAKDAWRLFGSRGEEMEADVLSLKGETIRPGGRCVLVDPANPAQRKVVERVERIEPLLEDYISGGELVRPFPSWSDIRARRVHEVQRLDPTFKRLLNPHLYKVGLTEQCWEVKRALIEGDGE